MSFQKRGSDNLINGAIFGAIFGYLIATSSVGWIQNIVASVMGVIPSSWTWLTSLGYAKEIVFAFLGAVIGYALDYM